MAQQWNQGLDETFLVAVRYFNEKHSPPSFFISGCARVYLLPNLHYTRRITPKRVTSCGAHLCGLAPGQHSSEETSQRWRVVGDIVSI